MVGTVMILSWQDACKAGFDKNKTLAILPFYDYCITNVHWLQQFHRHEVVNNGTDTAYGRTDIERIFKDVKTVYAFFKQFPSAKSLLKTAKFYAMFDSLGELSVYQREQWRKLYNLLNDLHIKYYGWPWPECRVYELQMHDKVKGRATLEVTREQLLATINK